MRTREEAEWRNGVTAIPPDGSAKIGLSLETLKSNINTLRSRGQCDGKTPAAASWGEIISELLWAVWRPSVRKRLQHHLVWRNSLTSLKFHSLGEEVTGCYRRVYSKVDVSSCFSTVACSSHIV